MKEKKDELWEKVKKEFPKNPTLQDVHYARLKIQEETKGMSYQKYIQYIQARAQEVRDRKAKKSH
jgi:hypothetical protein